MKKNIKISTSFLILIIIGMCSCLGSFAILSVVKDYCFKNASIGKNF